MLTLRTFMAIIKGGLIIWLHLSNHLKFTFVVDIMTFTRREDNLRVDIRVLQLKERRTNFMAWVRMGGGGTSFPSPFNFLGMEGTYNVPTNGTYTVTALNYSPTIVSGCTLNFKMYNTSAVSCYYTVQVKTQSSDWITAFTSPTDSLINAEYNVNLNAFVGEKITVRITTKSNQQYSAFPWTWNGANIIKE